MHVCICSSTQISKRLRVVIPCRIIHSNEVRWNWRAAWFYKKVLVYFAFDAAVVLASLFLAALRLHCCSDYNCEGPNGQLFFAPNQLNKCV